MLAKNSNVGDLEDIEEEDGNGTPSPNIKNYKQNDESMKSFNNKDSKF